MGDALCTFNPVYGQGMTVAVLEAQVLATCLRSAKRDEQFAQIFHRKVARVLAFPWRLAAGADAQATVTRKRFSYVDHLIALLPHDPHALLVFLQVIHLIRSPVALFSPFLAAKVLRQYWRHSRPPA